MKQRLIKIDGKTRTDPKFPTGFMDVVQIDKTGENFRIIYDVKGRFTVHRITASEAAYKLFRGAFQMKCSNPFQGCISIKMHNSWILHWFGFSSVLKECCLFSLLTLTHFSLPQVNDSIQLDLATNKV